MLPRAHLNREMPLVSLEECSFWGKVAFPEKYSGVSRRVRETIQAILEKHPEESVVLVGHGLSVDYMVIPLLVMCIPHKSAPKGSCLRSGSSNKKFVVQSARVHIYL